MAALDLVPRVELRGVATGVATGITLAAVFTDARVDVATGVALADVNGVATGAVLVDVNGVATGVALADVNGVATGVDEIFAIVGAVAIDLVGSDLVVRLERFLTGLSMGV